MNSRMIFIKVAFVLIVVISTLKAVSPPVSNINLISNSNEEYYFTKIDKSLFKVTGSDKLVQYKCSYGGEPLAIWSTKIDEVIDSSLDLKPTYVKEGYTASKLVIEPIGKSNRKERDGIHLYDENLPKGSIYYELARDKEFYVNTANFPVFLSEFSKKTVANFHIHTDNTKFSGNNPSQQYSFVISNGFFIYEKTKLLFGRSFTWDQSIDWSNILNSNKQDIYMRTTPRFVNENLYEGFGFWVCGSDEKPTEDINIEELKSKKGFVHLDKKSQISKKDILTLLMHNYEIPETSDSMIQYTNLK